MSRGVSEGVNVGLLEAVKAPPNIQTKKATVYNRLLEVVPALREQKGTWFKVGEWEFSKTGATAMATRLRKEFPLAEWTTRRVGDGSVLYGRWVGK